MREAVFVIGRRTFGRKRQRIGSWPRTIRAAAVSIRQPRCSNPSKQLHRRVVIREVPSCANGPTELGVQRLDRVRRVDDPPHAFGVGEEGTTCSQLRPSSYAGQSDLSDVRCCGGRPRRALVTAAPYGARLACHCRPGDEQHTTCRQKIKSFGIAPLVERPVRTLNPSTPGLDNQSGRGSCHYRRRRKKVIFSWDIGEIWKGCRWGATPAGAWMQRQQVRIRPNRLKNNGRRVCWPVKSPPVVARGPLLPILAR